MKDAVWLIQICRREIVHVNDGSPRPRNGRFRFFSARVNRQFPVWDLRVQPLIIIGSNKGSTQLAQASVHTLTGLIFRIVARLDQLGVIYLQVVFSLDGSGDRQLHTRSEIANLVVLSMIKLFSP